MTTSRSEPELYLREHAIDPDLAAAVGVAIDGDALRFPDGRVRSFNGDGASRITQPSGRELGLWSLRGELAPGAPVLLCEGESDALAALCALERSPEAAGFRGLDVVSVPGTGYPVDRLVAELRRAPTERVWLAFDGDEPGRRFAAKAGESLVASGTEVRVIELADGRDLADELAASEDRGEWIANALADAPTIEADPIDDPAELVALTARQTCALPDPLESDQLLGPLLTRGNRLVLGGGTGEGKTTLSLALLSAVVNRTELLGWTGSGGRALVIDAEQGLRTVKRRLTEASLDDSELVDYVRVPDGLALDSNPEDIAAVERLLRDGNYAAVCADPLYKLHTGDSNAEREAVDLMRRFDRWREEYRFALLLPVHLRKPPPGSRFSLNEFFGSSAYLRGAEVIIGVQRVSDGYSRLHFLKDRDGDLPVPAAWGLLFDRENGYRRDPSDGTNEPTCRQRVAELLADGPYTVEQLVELTGNGARTVKRALGELEAVGVGRPKAYRLPDEVRSEELEWT